MFKYKIPAILKLLFPSYTWKVNTKDKQLFLTFDDGPHPEITPWVLDQLSIYNAKATFFCVGENVKKYPDTFARLIVEGHSAGNHTFHHLNGWKTDNEAYIEDIQKAAELIPGKLFRPPYGRIKRSQAQKLKNKYQIVMWDRLSCDYEKGLNIAESMKRMQQVENGSIVVFHDSEKANDNLRILLPALLKYYFDNGFKMESIPQKYS